MNKNINIILIRSPLNINLVLSMFLLILITLFNILRNTEDIIYYLIGLVLCILYTAILTIALIRRFLLKPKTIRFGLETLTIENQNLNADLIKRIYIHRNMIGIRLINKKIVPMNLCFEFINRGEGIKVLNEWAQENRIQVIRSNFFKWM